MKSETRTERQKQIESAAYLVLEKKGFSGASMLAIAKQAKASNETLYRWYKDKNGLVQYSGRTQCRGYQNDVGLAAGCRTPTA